jgi:hypothetical protein
VCVSLSNPYSPRKNSPSVLLFALQNQERKHRTYVYVLIVTEVLEDWEDSVNIGKSLPDSLEEFPTSCHAIPQHITQNQKDLLKRRNNRRACLTAQARML